jgi:hypothetical protein
MLGAILGLAGLLLATDPPKREKLEVRFGFAEVVQVSGTPDDRFRLEMVLSPKAQSEYSDKMEKFYGRLKGLYCAPGPEAHEKLLTESGFRSLSSDRVGDLYTVVTPGGSLEGTVAGGVITIDSQFSDLFRLYLELTVPGSRSPGNGRTAVIGIKGNHRVGPWSAFRKTETEGATRERVERMLRTQGVPLEKYCLSYFTSGADTLVVVQQPPRRGGSLGGNG